MGAGSGHVPHTGHHHFSRQRHVHGSGHSLCDLPDLYDTLGLFIPLIVVNCIVLGRAEAFASKNNVWHSLLDGLFMGLGFTWALTLVGLVRELLGAGAVFGQSIIGGNDGMLLFILAPGGFLVLGFVMALVKKIQK